MGSDRALGKKSMKPITLTRRLTLGIIAISACAVLVGAIVLSNFVIPSTFRVTSQPGITCYESDGTTILSSIQFGDIQQGSTPQTHQFVCKVTGGNVNQYFMDQSSTSPSSPDSLQVSGLPSGVSLSWNFPSIYGQSVNCGGENLYPCVGLSVGSGTQVLTLTLAASTGATPGIYSATINIQAFSSASG